MKFDCGKRSRSQHVTSRHRALRLWHRWFAWYPVRIGQHDCRWLEFVQRKGTYKEYYDFDGYGSFWIWEYKA